MKFYTAKYDRAFKAVFLTEDKRLLQELISRILKRKVEVVDYLRNELNVSNVNEKEKIVDVLVKCDDEYIHIEINTNISSYTKVRNFTYFTNIYEGNVRRGDRYNVSTKFIHIDLSYNLDDNEDYRVYYVQDKFNKKYVNNFEIIEYNMDKIVEYWYNEDEEKIREYKHLMILNLDRDTLDQMEEDDWYMKHYRSEIERINDDTNWSSLMTYEEDQKINYNTDIYLAKEEGSKNEKISIAKSMKEKNLDINLISECTGLSIKEIEKL